MMNKYDVLVIGGGPSGLHTARRCAARGLHTLVLERKNDIGRDVICTGIVGRDIFSEFEIHSDSILREIQAVRMISPSGIVLDYRHPVPFACVVNREAFDRGLAGLAAAEGAEIRLGHMVTDLRVDRAGIAVAARCDDGASSAYFAKMAVLATGIDFTLNKKIGLGVPLEYLNGIQTEVAEDNPGPTTLYVGKNIARGAFAWAVPSAPFKTRIGLITEGDAKVCFRNLLKKHYPEERNDADSLKPRLKPIAQGLVSPTYGERILAVGEAAGQVKTTTGGGIYFGLVCSEIAARTISENIISGHFSSRSLAEYERAWRDRIQKEIVIGAWSRKLGARLSDSQMEMIFRLAQVDGILPLVREKGKFDWHSGLILSLIKRIPMSLLRTGLSDGYFSTPDS